MKIKRIFSLAMIILIIFSTFLDMYPLKAYADDTTRYADDDDIIKVIEKEENKDSINWELIINKAANKLGESVVNLHISNSHILAVNEFTTVLQQQGIEIEINPSNPTSFRLKIPEGEKTYKLSFKTEKQIEVVGNFEVEASMVHENVTYEADDRVYYLEDIEATVQYKDIPEEIELPPTKVYLVNKNTGEMFDEVEIENGAEEFKFSEIKKYNDENVEMQYQVITDPIGNYETSIDDVNITHTYLTTDVTGNIKNETNQTVTLKLFDGSSNQVINTQEIPPSAVEYTFEELPQKREDSSDIDYVVSAEEIEGYTIDVSGLDVIVTKDESEVEETEENASEKTDESEVEETEENTSEKTDESEVEETEENTSEKTDESEVEETEENTSEKTDESEVEETEESTSEKTDESEVEETEENTSEKTDESEVEETEENTSEKTDEPEVEETEVEVDLEKDEGKINKATQESMMRSFRSARINPFGIAPLQLQSNNQYTFTKSQDIRYRRGLMANDVVGSIQGVMNESQNEITWKITLSFSGGVYNPRVFLTDFKLSDGLQVTKVSYDNKEETALSFVELGEVSPSKDLIITTRITDPSAPILRLEAGNVNTYGNNFGPLWGQFQMITEKPSVNEVTNLSTKVTGKTEPNATVIIRDSNGHQVGQTRAESDGVFSATIPNQEVGTMLTVESTAPQKLLSEKVNIDVELDPDTPLNDVVVNDFYDVETGVRGESDEGTFVTIRDVNGRVLGSSRTIMTEEGPMFYVDLHRTFPANTELIAVAHNTEGKVSNETPFIVKPTEGGQLPPNVYLERQNPYPTYDGSKGINGMGWDERELHRNRVPQPIEYEEGFLWKYGKSTNEEDIFSVDLKTQGRSNMNKAPLDIVLVIDNSGSMTDSRWFGKSRWDSMNEVLRPFIQNMTRDSNTRFAVVNYARDIISQQNFSNDYNEIVSAIPNSPQNPLSRSAGTFTQLGLIEGGKYIQSARPEAEKVMILLTDGAPTYSYEGTRATSPEDITVFSGTILGNGTTFNMQQLVEFQYNNYSIGNIDIRNHGQPTISQAKILRNQYPNMKLFGVGLELDIDTHYSTTAQRTYVLEQIATAPEYAFNTTNILDNENGLNNILNEITERVSRSISAGVVTDPIGEMYDLDLGSDGIFNAEDYVLTASHPDLLEDVVPQYNSSSRTISLTGLNLGAGEWVNINYNLKLRTNDFNFEEDKWYPMNGETYLKPSPDTSNERSYPVPEAKGILPDYDFSLLKTDELGTPLEGASFTLSGRETTLNEKSNYDGRVVFSSLKPGDYELSESQAPDGYIRDETVYTVSISRQGVITVNDTIYDSERPFTIINESIPVTGGLTVIKNDASNEEKHLSGAVFELQDEDGSIVAEGTSDENGKITFDNLSFGEYELIEVKAPNGYMLDETPITVIINQENMTQEIKVENTKATMPNTGGSGTVLFTITGILLIFMALMYRNYRVSRLE